MNTDIVQSTDDIRKVLPELTSAPTPTSAQYEEPTEKTDQDLLGLLKITFINPMASLLMYYVRISKGRKKSLEQAMHEFRSDHSYVYRSICILDGILRIIYIAVVFLVVVRGLALHDFIFELIRKSHEIR